jgi:pyrimidine deaminase RibD-like protein
MILKLTHPECMELAIHMAGQCRPDNKAKTPHVGAVIALEGESNNEVHAFANRAKDDHAEQLALDQLPVDLDFAKTIVYTTLEPCTKDVRRTHSRSCAQRLVDHHVKKVVIGILDPNQGVCGKGVLQLQKADIEVELFPHEMAKRITVLNEDFIYAQQGYGIEITYPKQDEPVPLSKTTVTEVKLRGTWNRRTQQQDRLYAITEGGGRWWPQAELHAESDDEWTAKVWVRRAGRHTARIVRANELGNALMQYYWRMAEVHETWKKEIRDKLGDQTYELKGGLYHPIPMSDLPKGLDEEAWVSFIVQ